ncbi:MAG: YceI family protein [Acidobacteriota bacterium]
MKNWMLLLCIVLLAGLTAVGCANPAADAPEATVEEPAATETPADSAEANPEAGTLYAVTPDNGSTISWVGSKVTGSHDGGFEVFSGDLLVTGDSAEGSKVSVNIDATSLWSDNDGLTEHLKSPDFFEVETFSTASFESTAIAANEAGGYDVTGNLDLHGVTKQITFPAEIEVAGDQVAVAAEFAIKRFDWGIVYEGRADDLIRDDVLIKLNLVATNSAAGGAEEAAPEDEATEEAA